MFDNWLRGWPLCVGNMWILFSCFYVVQLKSFFKKFVILIESININNYFCCYLFNIITSCYLFLFSFFSFTIFWFRYWCSTYIKQYLHLGWLSDWHLLYQIPMQSNNWWCSIGYLCQWFRSMLFGFVYSISEMQ